MPNSVLMWWTVMCIAWSVVMGLAVRSDGWRTLLVFGFCIVTAALLWPRFRINWKRKP